MLLSIQAWLEFRIGVTCPKDGGDIVSRSTRKGRISIRCANYPQCDFTSWEVPRCPSLVLKCGGLLVIANKREAQCTVCEESFLLENIVPETVQE